MAKQIHVRSILEGYFNGLSFNNIARTRHLGKQRAWRARELFYTECRTCSCIETTLQRKKFLKKLANYDFLIIDEWPSDPLNEKQLSFIYELVEKRTEVHSTIFCGQFSPKEWYARLGSSSKTESMLNRIFSGLCKVDCGDFNMREYLSSHKLVIWDWCSRWNWHRCCRWYSRCYIVKIFSQASSRQGQRWYGYRFFADLKRRPSPHGSTLQEVRPALGVFAF